VRVSASAEKGLELKMKKLAATIIIARTAGGDDDKPMRIEINDEISGCRVLTLAMRLDEFAKALTSSQGAAEMEWYDNAPIGMKAENKTEIVPFDMYKGRESERKITEALKGWEVDGWKARRSDMINGHCTVKIKEGERSQRVVFFRHVDPETGKPIR
jgi:hypothetical protein